MHRDRSCHSHCQEKLVEVGCNRDGCWEGGSGILKAWILNWSWVVLRSYFGLQITNDDTKEYCKFASAKMYKGIFKATILCLWCLGMYILSCFGPRCQAETFIGPVGQHPSDKEIQRKISQEKIVGKDKYQSIGISIISCYDKYMS